MKILRPKTINHLLLLTTITTLTATSAVAVAGPKQAGLSLKSFIEQASAKDVTFESILIDQMPLQYQRDILLPDSDIIMDVKYQHNFYLGQDRSNPQASISLSKLFPYNGTKVSLSYAKSSSVFNTSENADLEFLISQPIANNAFGKSTRLQDKIIGLENDISRFQIIEAYEDYLASLTAAYYNWYSAYENLKVGKSSYQSNLKLMDNILDRQRQKIALPIDVNKMKLLLIGKEENIIILEKIYQQHTNLIFKAIGHKSKAEYIPLKPAAPVSLVEFEKDYENFTQVSRTYKILNRLEQQGELTVTKAADELLPSTSLLLGYKLDGQDWGIKHQQDNLYAGITLSWPIGHSVNKAKKQLAQIEYKKTQLSNQNKYEDLRINLKNIFLQIQREEKLIAVSEKKIKLAEAILKDEAENYSYGKVSLNDYIIAVNRVDEIRFSNTEHSVQLNKLLIEWLRLTDQLVDEKILNENRKTTLINN